MNGLNYVFCISLTWLLLGTSGCKEHAVKDYAVTQDPEEIFPKGEKPPAENFTGTVWVHRLVADDSIFHCNMASVTFEPGARSNWHKHPSGQLLIITAGNGLYQERGKSIKKIQKGDVVKCPPNTEHWHGAGPESSMTHIAVNPNTENGIVEWLQKVTDEEYSAQEQQ